MSPIKVITAPVLVNGFQRSTYNVVRKRYGISLISTKLPFIEKLLDSPTPINLNTLSPSLPRGGGKFHFDFSSIPARINGNEIEQREIDGDNPVHRTVYPPLK